MSTQWGLSPILQIFGILLSNGTKLKPYFSGCIYSPYPQKRIFNAQLRAEVFSSVRLFEDWATIFCLLCCKIIESSLILTLSQLFFRIRVRTHIFTKNPVWTQNTHVNTHFHENMKWGTNLNCNYRRVGSQWQLYQNWPRWKKIAQLNILDLCFCIQGPRFYRWFCLRTTPFYHKIQPNVAFLPLLCQSKSSKSKFLSIFKHY